MRLFFLWLNGNFIQETKKQNQLHQIQERALFGTLVLLKPFFCMVKCQLLVVGFVKPMFVFVNQTKTSTLAQRRPKTTVHLFCLQKKLDPKFEKREMRGK